MCSKLVELINLGEELRVVAQRRGASVTQSYFLVHEVLAPALRHPDQVAADATFAHLAAKLESKLGERTSAHA